MCYETRMLTESGFLRAALELNNIAVFGAFPRDPATRRMFTVCLPLIVVILSLI